MKTFNHVKTELGYDDLPCFTRETGRTYISPDRKTEYFSITTILEKLARPHINAWKERIGLEEANKILFRSSRRGTSVHEAIEKYLNNDPDYLIGYMPNIIENFLSIKPLLQRIGNIYGQETALYSDHLGVAGRVDCVADFDGVPSIIDFKTSMKPKKREWCESYFKQECFYSIAWEERTGMNIPQLVTIMAVDNNPPQLYIEQRDVWVHPLQEAIKYFKNN